MASSGTHDVNRTRTRGFPEGSAEVATTCASNDSILLLLLCRLSETVWSAGGAQSASMAAPPPLILITVISHVTLLLPSLQLSLPRASLSRWRGVVRRSWGDPFFGSLEKPA